MLIINLFMKKILLFICLLFFSPLFFACSCECEGDCTFKKISNTLSFVALVRVIEYSDYLDDKITNYEGKMPFSMIVEVVKKYKGKEVKKRIKIWGDDGALCRPYIANFEIGKYYLIAPSLISDDSKIGKKGDYDFYVCWTMFLEVDYDRKMVYGKYTKLKRKISLDRFERNLKLSLNTNK